ncbi:exonuclease domain-containing protein [Hyunsoonleella pacifica]|uniref:DNA polymerase III subunit epsilon n=1 Tax=Hyunsoonleella pacifica TaxID=1080224 RepID=A0A4Q9FPP2_9FLAO|nr:exonuclease domain-containing protein [Hyunsoonleella pacifica]TBN17381.1 DNA polymerase III subunit epsilon [Hyunsoonleella pacifica]GGD12451.1 exonuclease [Hyunsoonleella pacifica]
MMYTIIDVETTGKSNKLTEISIFKYDGTQVVDEYTSLINPEQWIPDYITALTGIDNGMVADAPTFAEIAETILAFTDNCIFVAHNVNFDYNAIRNEFKAIGIDFNRKKLCTIRLSRQLIPGHKSYSLGKLCNALHIHITDRHRARGDAEATVILFELLLQQDNAEAVFSDFLKKSSKEATLPSHLPTSVFNNLPSTPGVYYFKNKKGKIIYVGKAKDIKKRVLSHFYSKTKKSLAMCRETADIDFELSGSELIALLMEDAAIKQHYPEYNQVAKRSKKRYAIFSYTDRKGIVHMAYNTLKAAPNPVLILDTITECRHEIERICSQFYLCPKYCHLQEAAASCNHFKIHTCKGICKDEEPPEVYNQRALQALESLQQHKKDIILKQKGRYAHEDAFIMIEQGTYLGYGFIDKTEQINTIEDFEAFLIRQQDNSDVQKIIRRVLIKETSTI